MKTHKGILFDLDGVITDTAEYHYLAWKKLADSLDIPFDKEANEQLKGLSRMDSLEVLLGERKENYSEDEKNKFTYVKNEYYLSLLESLSEADILPGIQDILIKLKEHNVPVGLASASKNAPLVLEKLGLSNYFQEVVNPSEAGRGKPAPDIYLKGAELLGLSPDSCVGIEDAVSGVQAVKSAGMTAIGVGDIDALQKAGADYAVRSTEQLNWNLIQRFL